MVLFSRWWLLYVLMAAHVFCLFFSQLFSVFVVVVLINFLAFVCCETKFPLDIKSDNAIKNPAVIEKIKNLEADPLDFVVARVKKGAKYYPRRCFSS